MTAGCGHVQLIACSPRCPSSPPQGGTHLWPSLTQELITALQDASQQLSAVPGHAWFPKYGAALVAFPLGDPSAASSSGIASARVEALQVYMVALDDWTYTVHSCESGLEPAAECVGSELLYCGSLPASAYGELIQRVHAAEAKAADDVKKGGDKTKKLQRVPAFIHTLVAAVLHNMEDGKGDESIHAAERGGTTDVGQHTGSTARDTCWPLARETFRVRPHRLNY
jgi:hypothetical protein